MNSASKLSEVPKNSAGVSSSSYTNDIHVSSEELESSNCNSRLFSHPSLFQCLNSLENKGNQIFDLVKKCKLKKTGN